MKSIKPILLIVGLAALGLLGVALYLQHKLFMLPCPLCVEQRYAFFALAIICLISALLPHNAARIGAFLSSITALVGTGIAGYHLWVKANPAVTCGIDPLEETLNQFIGAKLLPFLFYADGMCTTEYDPILGLSIPQWSLVWFVIFAIVLGWAAWRRAR